MQIFLKNQDTIEVKTKQSVIKLTTNGPSKINEVELVGPGEYEIADVQVRGLTQGEYLIKTEEMNLVYLNGVSSLSQEQIESLGDVDVLVVPARYPNLITLVDPKIIIPFGKDLTTFCAQEECPAPVASVKISKKDLAEDKHQIVVLKS